MQSVTNNLIASLNRQTPVYAKSVELYRQLWTGSAYVFDSAVDITAQIKDAGKIMWKLDKEGFNVWTVSNTTLTIRNDRQQWKQDNPKGYFPSGYLQRGSKIRIKVGAQLADGTFEKPYVFTGYIKTDSISNSDDKTVVITLEGGLSIFAGFNAEDISNPITDEAHPYATPGQVDFNTTNNGVAAVGLVVKRGITAAGVGAATVILPTTGYTITNQNIKGTPLTVTLVSALTATESLWFTYKYWYTDKTYEWLVEQVMILCGVTSYSITPAVFSSSILNTWNFNSQADWNTCSLSNIDTITTPGSFKAGLIDDFEDGDYSANPTWTVGLGSWQIIDEVWKKLLKPNSIGSTENEIYLTSNSAVGTWAFDTRYGVLGGEKSRFYFISSTSTKSTSNGYSVALEYDGLTNHQIVRLYRHDAGSETVIGSYNLGSDYPYSYSFRIVRDNAGITKIYINSILRITATDNTYTTSGYFLIYEYIGYERGIGYTNVYFWETIGLGILTSPAHGAITGLNSWGKLTSTYTANIGTVLIETSVWNGASWDAWTAIDGSGQILSTAYDTTDIKFRVTLNILYPFDNLDGPKVDEIYIAYYSSTTVISLVNLTGMKCEQVLSDCSIHPCYEYGSKADDTFIYRPRSTTLPAVIALSSATNVQRLQNVVDGSDRVKNRIVANFGIYTVTADTTGDAEPTSKTKYGDQEYNVPSSALLPADNVNIAYAIAPTILAYSKNPRKRCQAVCKSLPYLELGDNVTLTFEEPTAFRSWKWGDRDVHYGDPDIEYYDEATKTARISFNNTSMRIEGMELEWWDRWEETLDLVKNI